MAVVLMAILATGVSAAPTLTFHFRDVKFPGAAGTSAYGINDAGIIVGQYYDSQGVFHGFKLDHGKGTTIDDPNGTDTICYGINSSGSIVGSYTSSSTGQNRGFLYKDGKFTDIAPGALSGASGINDNGIVVGEAANCLFCAGYGFVWNGHKFKKLVFPGAAYTSAGDINNHDVITIVAPDSNLVGHSYLYRNGKYTEVKVPGAVDSYLEGNNNSDDLVFAWDNGNSGTSHGALRYKGRFYKFDAPKGRNETAPFQLNDHRQIVGVVFFGPSFLATY